jgi:hypothetical protein
MVFNSQGQPGGTNRGDRGFQGNGEGNWWRERFEELKLQFEGIRANDASNL